MFQLFSALLSVKYIGWSNRKKKYKKDTKGTVCLRPQIHVAKTNRGEQSYMQSMVTLINYSHKKNKKINKLQTKEVQLKNINPSIFAVFLLEFHLFTKKPVFECAFAHPIMLFLSYLVNPLTPVLPLT